MSSGDGPELPDWEEQIVNRTCRCCHEAISKQEAIPDGRGTRNWICPECAFGGWGCSFSGCKRPKRTTAVRPHYRKVRLVRENTPPGDTDLFALHVVDARIARGSAEEIILFLEQHLHPDGRVVMRQESGLQEARRQEAIAALRALLRGQ